MSLKVIVSQRALVHKRGMAEKLKLVAALVLVRVVPACGCALRYPRAGDHTLDVLAGQRMHYHSRVAL